MLIGDGTTVRHRRLNLIKDMDGIIGLSVKQCDSQITSPAGRTTYWDKLGSTIFAQMSRGLNLS